MNSNIKVNEGILSIDPYIGGTSKIAGVQKVIKLSSNENALGTSKLAIKAYLDEANNLFRYPDGGAVNLIAAIAAKYQLDPQKIVCGAGSDEIIHLITASFTSFGDEVIYSKYGFLMYPIATKVQGSTPIAVEEDNLTTSVDNILAKINNKTKIIFIANPNNPTGTYIATKEVKRLLDSVPSNVVIVMDCAYAEFVTEEDYTSCFEFVSSYKNLIITRTFSKVHGLASLRLGWCYADNFITSVLNRIRGPFNTSIAAQVAGIAAINDDDFVSISVEHNTKERNYLTKELELIGLKLTNSVANFILVDFGTKEKAQNVNAYLLNNGIIGRMMESYKLPQYIRFTVGREEENKLLVNFIKKAIS